MAFDSTPWFIGGGAHHSPDVARLLAYAASGAQEGIVGPGDFKVSAPGADSVNIAPGAAVILNRSAGGQQQAYIMRAPTTTSLAVPTTGAAARSDLVVIRVEDPQYSPWTVPNDPVAAQYVFPRLIQGVPGNTTSAVELNLGYSAIAIARIDQPANSSTVTSAMVKDVRALAQPRTARVVQTGSPAAANVSLTSSTFVTFPDYTPQILVPSWATTATVMASMTSLGRVSGDTTGAFRARLGSMVGTDQSFNYEGTAGDERVMNLVVAQGSVTALQGTLQTLSLEGRQLTGPGALKTLAGTRVIFDVNFEEKAV